MGREGREIVNVSTVVYDTITCSIMVFKVNKWNYFGCRYDDDAMASGYNVGFDSAGENHPAH